jgi:hypothetical protein
LDWWNVNEIYVCMYSCPIPSLFYLYFLVHDDLLTWYTVISFSFFLHFMSISADLASEIRKYQHAIYCHFDKCGWSFLHH